MRPPTTRLGAAALMAILAGCATVRQTDLDAWAGVPVAALDTHPLFVTIPMYRTLTEGGIEIRNYVNSQAAQQCFTRVEARHRDHHDLEHTAFMACSDNGLVCNNLFYVQGGQVIRYAPTGDCYTDARVRPQPDLPAHRAPAR
ncbi:MAG TPA: hypothetical protein VMS38_04840 [Pseudorhodoferax sp.]|nr:hypothetical protein [Pseudorhodoferax sp.]